MGLFGYNKRDFEKNTEKFKKRIENIMHLDSNFAKDFADERSQLIRCLIRCANDLTNLTYNEHGSDYRMIDKEINKILGNIEEALSRKEGRSAVGYAELLYDEISCCRLYGKNIFSDTDRQAKLRRTVLISRLSDIAKKREAISNRKKEILKIASELSDEMRGKYKVEFDVLCSEDEKLEEQFIKCHELYQTHIAYMNAIENKKFADRISELFGTAEAIQKELEASKGSRPSGFESTVNEARENKGKATPENEEITCSYCGSHNYSGE